MYCSTYGFNLWLVCIFWYLAWVVILTSLNHSSNSPLWTFAPHSSLRNRSQHLPFARQSLKPSCTIHNQYPSNTTAQPWIHLEHGNIKYSKKQNNPTKNHKRYLQPLHSCILEAAGLTTATVLFCRGTHFQGRTTQRHRLSQIVKSNSGQFSLFEKLIMI